MYKATNFEVIMNVLNKTEMSGHLTNMYMYMNLYFQHLPIDMYSTCVHVHVFSTPSHIHVHVLFCIQFNHAMSSVTNWINNIRLNKRMLVLVCQWFSHNYKYSY